MMEKTHILETLSNHEPFEFSGSPSAGTTIWYGSQRTPFKFSAEDWRRLLVEFRGRTVAIGPDFRPEERPEGSLGAYLTRHTQTSVASYLAAILVDVKLARPVQDPGSRRLLLDFALPPRAEVARKLADLHFEVEPAMIKILWIRPADEDDPTAPIRLLEVTPETVPTGKIEGFGFAPTVEFPYNTIVAEVTPAEFEAMAAKPGEMPKGWSLANSVEFTRGDRE